MFLDYIMFDKTCFNKMLHSLLFFFKNNGMTKCPKNESILLLSFNWNELLP